MTARELVAELERLGVRVTVEGGRPQLDNPHRRDLTKLLPDLKRLRADVLQLVGADVWDAAAAVAAEVAADDLVAASGVPGTNPEVAKMAAAVCAAGERQDVASHRDAVAILERVVRRLAKEAPR